MPDNRARIKHLIKYMEYDYLTDAEHDLVVSFEEQFENKGALSYKQLQILEQINSRADLRDRPYRR